jgi:enoyl-CoA hydratase
VTDNGPPLLIERRNANVILTLNRPDRLNAVSREMYAAIVTSLEEMSKDKAVRALILTGAGRAFCAGADLKAHQRSPLNEEEKRVYASLAQEANRHIQHCSKPIIAAVNGPAIGAGLELALSCDFIIVADEAKLRFPEVALGTFVGGGCIYTLVRRVGFAKAKELLLLGNFCYGSEAMAIGLANKSVSASLVMEEAMNVAQRLTEMAPVSMALAKDLLNRSSHLDADTAMKLEVEALLKCMATKDWREGVQAFAEKRKPNFSGE